MAHGPRYKVEYKRKKSGRTDYKKRLNLLKSKKTRLVIRKSNKHITAQFVDYDPNGDKVLASVRSDELKTFGWKFSFKNTPAAYLTGLLCGCKGKEKKISDAIVDMGLNSSTKGSKLYAVVRGALDSGLLVPSSEKIFPDDNRTFGKVIEDHFKKEGIVKNFEEVKIEIEKKFKIKIAPKKEEKEKENKSAPTEEKTEEITKE